MFYVYLTQNLGMFHNKGKHQRSEKKNETAADIADLSLPINTLTQKWTKFRSVAVRCGKLNRLTFSTVHGLPQCSMRENEQNPKLKRENTNVFPLQMKETERLINNKIEKKCTVWCYSSCMQIWLTIMLLHWLSIRPFWRISRTFFSMFTSLFKFIRYSQSLMSLIYNYGELY